MIIRPKKATSIPEAVHNVSNTLKKADFEAYLIGGCVRDLLIGRIPKDWDITTNAKPEEIVALFKNTFYENTYGTVGVVNEEFNLEEDGKPHESLRVIEVTPYRLESEYSDGRRPDKVTFSDKLEDDLQRRDFTINAIALDIRTGESDIAKGTIVDLYKGQEDLDKKTIRTVGNPDERFKEDALRLLRAVRISTELGFTIEESTLQEIKNNLNLLGKISKERIRDEFIRILMSDSPMPGLELAKSLGLIKYITPKLEESFDVVQNKAHSYNVWEHLLRSLQHAADKKWPLEIRLAALFHDIAKPQTRRWSEEKKEWTFYGHDVVGAREVKKILSELKFSNEIIDTVVKLVRWHMFFSDTEQITLSAVRRLVAHVGKDRVWNLMNLRICDRVGTGRPKENPYRLRKYKSMVEEAMRDPISVAMLKIDGNKIMEVTNTKPGPKIGLILHALFEEVLNDPSQNTASHLEKRAMELSALPDKELATLGEAGKDTKQKTEEKEIDEIRKKYWVE